MHRKPEGKLPLIINILKYHSAYDGFLFNMLFWYVEFEKTGKRLFSSTNYAEKAKIIILKITVIENLA